MEPELRDLFRNVGTDPVGESYTHMTTYGPAMRWNVRPHMLSAFWTGYCDLVYKQLKGEQINYLANMCLAEKPQEVMPLISKFTFKFHADENDGNDIWEPYDDEFLYWLCHTYQIVLEENFNMVNEYGLEYTAIVLESGTHWYEENRETNQRFLVIEVRIQFPYSKIEAGIQSRIIRPRVIQLLRNNNIMSKMQRQPIGDWEQIISSNIVNEPIMMYGSSEVPNRPKLVLSYIWPYITRDMLESENRPDNISLEDAFTPDSHLHVQQEAVSSELFNNDRDFSYWIPLFLSVNYWTIVLRPKEHHDTRFTNQIRSSEEIVDPGLNFGGNGRRQQRDDEELSNMELCERMIRMFNNKRFTRESFWLDIGKALYSSDSGGDNGLLSWIRHSERCTSGISIIPDFMKIGGNISDTCRNLYYTFANCNISVKTLAWYAREDSPEIYANWHRSWFLSSMENALTRSDTDVTEALYRVYWLDFIYCSVGKGKWFQFRNHRWYEVNQGLELKKAMSRDFRKKFESVRAVLSRQIHESNDDGFTSNAENTMKKLTDLIYKLKTQPFKNRILAESCEYFDNAKFISLLDSNPELTGVTNGVLEVIGKTIEFRAAKPEDYISMCTNIPFHSSYSWNHPLVSECYKWITQCFTDKSLCHHFLKFASSTLNGGNNDKIFPIWTGEGDNSKSMIVKLFQSTLNTYTIKFPVSLLCEKSMNSSGASPQLARSKSTRIAFLDEPEDDIPMQKGTIKRYTGGDDFFARFLHDNGSDVKATFKMVLMCNKVPVIPNADRAIVRRTRLFPFLSTWVDDPPETEDQQFIERKFKKNPFFDRRIPILAPAFLWIMAQYYPHYSDEGLLDPPIITEYTESYWRDNDVYAQFAADLIQEVYTDSGEKDPTARVTLTEIYAELKIWFKDAFPGTKPPDRSVVKTELSSRWGRMIGNAWYGIRIINNDGISDMTSALGGRPKAVVPSQPVKPVVEQLKLPPSPSQLELSLKAVRALSPKPRFDISLPPGAVTI
ncbi:MAG: hypothetical protein P0116_15780 [Candidatus Nitrosocosmicus sp.]|nr:hypothetical protein [Candidatus Nitrosocosmicus sp.]